MERVLLVVGLFVASILTVQAQDNAVAAKKKDALKEQGEKIQKEESSGGDADMVKLDAADVPAVLRRALQSLEYQGWDAETSTIYGSEENDLYVVEIKRGKQTKTFYFDGEGKVIQD
ncbi:MAG TPA: hypothetical protein VG737_04530 [Cyclobacteriaceae bacterium]|nr:hypothetical protein [Cyclobacteriaceae bacterium]